ncbi:hypothetical protein ACLOJK_012623 [Asimina triloba]
MSCSPQIFTSKLLLETRHRSPQITKFRFQLTTDRSQNRLPLLGYLRWGLSVGSRLFRDSGQAIDFLFLVLLSETFYYLFNTHLSEPHLFVNKAEREECKVVAELRDRFP